MKEEGRVLKNQEAIEFLIRSWASENAFLQNLRSK